ncbi:kinase [Rossellomorea aquimaris]|uniref:kinase n=1 Tax=Rossellomorea aquimaris TaxID=189382 RepID=UPI001CD3A51C|nr:kinase [Rossellomorea aquimaris]MCA1054006.1 kinase [Rossellomorea aquimaris]
MESTLIIIRGNSGSGKTTTAKYLQKYLGHGTLLVSQDTVRRDMLKVHDRDGNLSIDLIRQIAEYGKGTCEYVIVEGILAKKRYGEMLLQLINFFDHKAFTYYFDLSFAETVRRHNASPKKSDFGVDSLKRWWVADDKLGLEGEALIRDDMTESDVFHLITGHLSTVMERSLDEEINNG